MNIKEQCGPEKCSSVWFKDWEVSPEVFSLLKTPEASVESLELKVKDPIMTVIEFTASEPGLCLDLT